MMLHAMVMMLADESFLDRFPWASDLGWALLAVGMVSLLVYLLRPAGPGVADFSIEVDAEEVRFKGRFPAASEAIVENFLRDDCRIEGSYEIIGKWEEGGRLAVTVRGEQAQWAEQRIRNFLKLNIKRM
jgi:hypothetical protein